MKTFTNEIRLMIPEECWFDAPGQLSRRFFPVFQQVAFHLHEAIRTVLPSLYFREPLRYLDTRYALPMLVFQASQPFHARPRAEFSYDVLSDVHLDAFFRNTRPRIFRVLADARCAVIASDLKNVQGHRDVDALYDPANFANLLRTVSMHNMYRKPLKNMLVFEGRLFDELVKLSACGNFPARARTKYIADFNHAWGVLLRHFCGAYDFTEAGPELLRAATHGLRAALRQFPAATLDARFDLAA